MIQKAKNKDEYIKFFSEYDVMCEYYLKKSEEILQNFDTKATYNINQIIELYNINKYFDNGRYSVNWNTSTIEKYKKIVSEFKKTIYIFFSKIDSNKIFKLYSELYFYYVDEFWELFDISKLYNTISGNEIVNILYKFCHINSILMHKSIVDKYHKEITDFMKNNIKCAYLIIDHYIAMHDEDYIPLYFPEELDKTKLIEQYVEYKDVSINYLALVGFGGNKYDDLLLTDEIRLKAQKKYRTKYEDEAVKIKTGCKVIFDERDDVISKESCNMVFTIKYGIKSIIENIKQYDYSLIYVFANIFDFIDKYANFFAILSTNDVSIFERVCIKGKKQYNCNNTFNILQAKGYLEVAAYNALLQNHNLDLEGLISWYFNSYIEDCYKIKGFNFHVCKSEGFYEKSQNLALEMDGILKQFNLFANNKVINNELLKIARGSISLSSVKSIFDDKYITLEGDEINIAEFYLCSDQSPILYIKRIPEKYDSFCEVLSNENVKIDDFFDNQKDCIHWLAEHKYITINDSKGIVPSWEKINPIILMFKYGAISTHRYKSNLLLNEFANLTRTYGTLFTEKEQDYLDYYLNDKKFTNGYRIRNIYAHPSYKPDEKEAEFHYYILLMLMILVLLKINDELCLYCDFNK